jgi:hypothetical protein
MDPEQCEKLGNPSARDTSFAGQLRPADATGLNPALP